MKFELGIFDFDGVIADSLQQVWEVEKELYRNLCILIPEFEFFRQSHDTDYDEYYMQKLGLDQNQYQLFNSLYRETEQRVKASMSKIQPISEALKSFNMVSNQYKIGNIHIVSGSDLKEIEGFLKRYKILHQYNAIHSVFDSKTKTLQKIIGNKKAFFVTDSGKDILSAKRAIENGVKGLEVFVLATKYSFSSFAVLESLANKNNNFCHLIRSYDELIKKLI